MFRKYFRKIHDWLYNKGLVSRRVRGVITITGADVTRATF